jgi:transcriptional regulator
MSLYQPPQFRNTDPAVAAQLMRDHPFASLISTDAGGFPFVSHLPVHAEERDGGFVLWAHCAKANPHWKLLQEKPRALVTFMGPHAFQSTRIYPDLARVPSWNYLAVHCTVDVRPVSEPAEKDALLKKLIGDNDPPYADQWRGLGEEFQSKMLAGIVGLEMTVTEWACKLKLNQHRPESHKLLREGYACGNDAERELAAWMDRLGLTGPAPGEG